jgi:hypothetical protein
MWSRVLDSDGLDPTAEEFVLLLQAVEHGVQLRDDWVRFVSDDDQFDI